MCPMMQSKPIRPGDDPYMQGCFGFYQEAMLLVVHRVVHAPCGNATRMKTSKGVSVHRRAASSPYQGMRWVCRRQSLGLWAVPGRWRHT